MYLRSGRPVVAAAAQVATINVIQFSSKAEPTGDLLVDTSNLGIQGFNHVCASFWVQLPATNGATNIRAAGWGWGDWSNDFATDQHASQFGMRLAYNETTDLWNVHFDVHVNNGGLSDGVRVDKTYTFADTTAKWKHFLIEYDSTEALRIDRFKCYLNDVLIVVTELDADADHNLVIASGTDPGSDTSDTGDFVIGEFLIGKHDITYPPPVVDFLVNTEEPFATVAATSNVAALWICADSASQFNFDNASERHNFITAGLAYVAHTATMGGDAAIQWGAGTKSVYTTNGYAEISSVVDTTVASPITAS